MIDSGIQFQIASELAKAHGTIQGLEKNIQDLIELRQLDLKDLLLFRARAAAYVQKVLLASYPFTCERDWHAFVNDITKGIESLPLRTKSNEKQ